MSECTKCNSPRIAIVGGKCSDMAWVNIESDNVDYQGYAMIFDNGGDYINIDICLDCGQVQGKFPISRKEIKEIFTDGEEDE
jgi:hypothetical protein